MSNIVETIDRSAAQLRAEAEHNGGRALEWIGVARDPIADEATARLAVRNAGLFALHGARAAAHVIALETAKEAIGQAEATRNAAQTESTKNVELRREAEAARAQAHEERNDLVMRLKSWAKANLEELKARRPPTWLNPRTVLAWMHEDAGDEKDQAELDGTLRASASSQAPAGPDSFVALPTAPSPIVPLGVTAGYTMAPPPPDGSKGEPK